ncbi:SCO6880 family protein [Nocardia sp. NPDC058176]|uniref:SCO6880 family protein n=1 Tax=Nocardia sp. NPDC058176 TaxID=3346368 RepID=UPI0036DF1576
MTKPASFEERRMYGLWTRPRNPGLFGFSWMASIAALVVIVVALLASAVADLTTALVIFVVGAIVVVPLGYEHNGKNGYERGILMFQWFRGVMAKENIYRAGVFSAHGSCKQPGLMAQTKLYSGVDFAGNEFGMIHMPKTNMYTVAVRCFPQGAQASDQARVDAWVGAWSKFMATLGAAPDVVAIVPVIDTIPETGNRLKAEVDYLVHDNAPPLAKAMMFELGNELPSEKVHMETWLSITFRATTPARRRDPAEQATEIGRRLPGILNGLADAGVRAIPMKSEQIIACTRRAWDPATEPDFEEAKMLGQPHGVSWDEAGPIGDVEKSDRLFHDGVVSVTWEMEQAPESAVDEKVLKRLIEPNPDLPRKRVAIVYRPHKPAEAVDIVDTDFKNATAAEQTERGVGSAAATIKVGATQQARQEQAQGHGVTRFGILITVTAHKDADDPSLEAITKDLSTQARLKIRRSHYYQAAAFAAGMGFGVVLPEMASVPKELS